MDDSIETLLTNCNIDNIMKPHCVNVVWVSRYEHVEQYLECEYWRRLRESEGRSNRLSDRNMPGEKSGSFIMP